MCIRDRWVGGGLNILFFLMQMISQVGDKFEFLKNVNPLTLFDYYGLAAGCLLYTSRCV